MKSSKDSSLHRSLSFVLIAILLIFVVGFAANAWNGDLKEPENGDVGDNTDDTDENTDGTDNPSGDVTPPDNQNPEQTPNEDDENNQPDPPIEIPPEPEPVYINKITGLITSKEQSESIPYGFVIDPSAPMYGISSSDISIEFPIEDGTTRMLSYTTDNSLLWKIGSLVETRAFISGMSNFLGGIIVSYGNDDIVKYSAWDTSKMELDLSRITNCSYVENTLYIYTSRDMLEMAQTQSPTLIATAYKTPPFLFSEMPILGNTSAKSVIIPYSQSSETALYYSEKSGEYLYCKSGSRKMDMLTGKNISYKNVFVLFANATTYEKANGSELVMDTLSGGNGYYFTNGTFTEIKWLVNANGALEFKSLSGEKLSINAGSSYISYYKASRSSSVKFN